MAKQARGSAARLILDKETSFGVPRTGSAKKPVIIPINSDGLRSETNLNDRDTIRGDRNPEKPWHGNENVSGDEVIPIDTVALGYFLRHAIGAITTTEVPTGVRTLTGGTTVTVSSGTATFSNALTDAAVGDRVMYNDGSIGFLTAKTSTTVWTLSQERDGTTPASDVTDASVEYVIENLAETSPGTVTISGTTATFSTAQTNAAVGQQLVYDGNNRAYLVSQTSSTVWEVKGGDGYAPTAGTTVDVESLEAKPLWSHVAKIGAVAELDSFMMERQIVDLDVPLFIRYSGCKINSFNWKAQGDADQELTATASLIAKHRDVKYIPYDVTDKMSGSPTISITSGTYTFSAAQASAAVGDIVVYQVLDGSGNVTSTHAYKIASVSSSTSGTLSVTGGGSAGTPSDVTGATVVAIYAMDDRSAVSLGGEPFYNKNASVTVGGSSAEILESVEMTISNDLDNNTRTIGSQGQVYTLPEEYGRVRGTANALFTGETIQRPARDKTESSIVVTVTKSGSPGTQSIVWNVPELFFQESDPPINGPAGVRESAAFTGFYDDNANASALVATLKNTWPSYAS